MRLVFEKQCSCEPNEHTCLPLPKFHTKAPNECATPEAIVDLSFECPKCGKPWKEGFIMPAKKPKRSKLLNAQGRFNE